MPFNASADSSRVQIRYVEEVTPGVTPSTPQMKNLRVTGESLSRNRTTVASAEIRSDRQTTDLITTGETATGDLNFELSYGEYDSFLESALQGVWTANKLVNGTTRKSFTIEKEFSDVAKFVQFVGCEVTNLSLNLAQQAVTTGAFTLSARNSNSATVSLDPTPTPSLTNAVYNTTEDIAGLTINGTAYPDGILTFAMALNNNARDQHQIGTKALAGIGMGTCSLTGTLTAYFGSGTAIQNAFDSDLPVVIEFTMVKNGNSYHVKLPAVKFSSMKTVAGAINQDVILDMAWTAIRDSSTGTTIEVTRTPSP